MSDDLEKKYITVFSPYLPPFPLAVSQRMRHFIEVLEDSNYEVNVLVGKKAHWGTSLWFDLPSGKPNFIFTLIRELLSGLELGIRLAKMHEPCALISSPPMVTAFFGALGAHLAKKYYILDIRDLQPGLFFASQKMSSKSPFGKLLLKMERWLYKRAAVIFTGSQRIAEDIQSRNPDLRGRVFPIWNGYDEDQFSEFSEKPNRFMVIYHGNFGPMNNLPLLRKIAQDLHQANVDVEIHCAGVGPGAALIKAANLPNLKLLPPIKPEELGKTLSAYHLALSLRVDSNNGESDFPAKVFECLGAGLPVLMTPKCEAGAFLMELKSGLQFDNADGGQIADAIKTYAANPAMLEQMYQNAMQVRVKLGRRSLRKALVEVLNQL